MEQKRKKESPSPQKTNTSAINIAAISGTRNKVSKVDNIEVSGLTFNKGSASYSSSKHLPRQNINVAAITGRENFVKNAQNIGVTGLIFNQDLTSSNPSSDYLPTEDINVAAITGEEQRVVDAKNIKVSGLTFNDGFISSNSPADSGSATGSLEQRVIYKVNNKSYEVLKEIGEGGSCKVSDKSK
jgi:hypothetical protein